MQHLRWTWLASFALLTGCAQVGFNCGSGSEPFRGHVSFRDTADAKGLESVIVTTRNGGVQVRGDAAATGVEVKGEKWARGITQESADELTARIEIQVRPDPSKAGRLEIAAVFPDVPNRNMGASFEITLPPGVAVEARTANGPLTVSDIGKDLGLQTSNGPITVTAAGGNVHATSSNGPITLHDVAGNVEARTSNGRIGLERAGKDEVRAETSNGSIDAKDTRGAVTLISSNGPVGLRTATLPKEPRVKVITSNARARVELPADVKARLDMHTSNASADAQLDGMQVSDLRTSRGNVSATLNGGGGSIEIRSSNGGVTLRPIPPTRPERE